MKKRIKRKLRKWGRRLLRNIICLIVGVAYAIYLLIRGFNNLVANLFMKLPRVTRVSIIYLLILGTGLALKNSFKNVTFEVSTNIMQKVGVPVVAETCQREHETSCKIEEKGKELGMTEEQINISIAISRWETGNYTSKAYYNNNNVGGMMCNSGLIVYENLEQGIEAFLTNLKYNYFDIGLDTLDKIQPKYCPVGASNDPTGLNQYWLNGTKKIYNSLEG